MKSIALKQFWKHGPGVGILPSKPFSPVQFKETKNEEGNEKMEEKEYWQYWHEKQKEYWDNQTPSILGMVDGKACEKSLLTTDTFHSFDLKTSTSILNQIIP